MFFKVFDWQFVDVSKINVGSGCFLSDVLIGFGFIVGLREFVIKVLEDIDMSGIGCQGKDGLSEFFKDVWLK